MQGEAPTTESRPRIHTSDSFRGGQHRDHDRRRRSRSPDARMREHRSHHVRRDRSRDAHTRERRRGNSRSRDAHKHGRRSRSPVVQTYESGRGLRQQRSGNPAEPGREHRRYGDNGPCYHACEQEAEGMLDYIRVGARTFTGMDGANSCSPRVWSLSGVRRTFRSVSRMFV
ncbi:hypothetical protein PoB_005674700 [Plakobranchus ocellatus]|uniref:Uncharacterized protein n=1 Tax=Plakobranchus ocellatus TaxID=259542 RepID=A0AAV4CG37_9GAST|nr:hypothetical protein PoB_005674700 [Plakobranchus ocellatus]